MENSYFKRNRIEMMKFLPKDFTNTLEIGCGQGEFGKLVKETFKTNYTGIEIDPQAALVAKEHLDLVLIGDAFELINILPDNSFDLLICNDVIEHIAEPEILFQKIRIKMKPESRIVCSIPNIRVLNSLIHIIINKDFEYTDWGIRDKTHLRFYTKSSMLRLLQRNGFKIEKIAGINPINTFKTSFLLGFLRLIGHGDIRYPQYGIVARF